VLINEETEITIDINDEIMTINSVDEWNGTTEVTVTAADGHGLSVNDAFLVIIDPVNDEPELIQEIPDYTVVEDTSGFEIDLTNYIIDVDEDELDYELVYNDSHISISITGNILTIVPIENWHGTTSVELTASDQEYSINDTFYS